MRIVISHDLVPGTMMTRLGISVHDAPHRRMLEEYRAMLRDYRFHLVAACRKVGIPVPIGEPIEVHVLFVNPTSPDLGNLYLALENAMDGAVVLDDSLIQKQSSEKMYVGDVVENAPVRLKNVA
jgi:hypothetical protein